MNTTKIAGGLVAVALSLSAGVLAAPNAEAKGLEVRRSGDCSARTDWKLKAKSDDGRIEVEFEVDSNRNGQRWYVTLRDNGSLFWSGYRTTLAPSGSFEVEKRTANRSGSDVIRAYARNTRTGEICRASLTFNG